MGTTSISAFGSYVIQEDVAHVLRLRQHRIISWLQEKVETSMPHWEPVEEHDVTDEAHLQVAGRVGPVVAFPYYAAYAYREKHV